MGYYARLKHGSHEIDLNAGVYCLASSFIPPSTNPATVVGAGLMSNRYAGGERVDRKFNDRALNVPVIVQADSQSETHNAARRLASFLEVSLNDKSEKTYFVFGASDAVPYEPKWGQQFLYYEIKDAPIGDVGRRYLEADAREAILVVNLPLLVSPLATGLRQRVGSATGSIFEDTYTSPDGISRGVVIPSGGTNKMTNPIFGHSTYDNNWTTEADITSTENTDQRFVYAGNSSAFVIRDAATNNRTFYQSINVGNVNQHTLSFYAKKSDSSAVTTADVVPFYGATQTGLYQAVGNGWYRVSCQFSGVAAGTATGCVIDALGEAGASVFVDGFQLEERGSYTPLYHGDMLDVAWTGTAHASTSTRTAARLRYEGTDLLNLEQGTIRFAIKVFTSAHSDNFYMIDCGASAFQIWWRVATTDWRFTDGTNTIDSDASSPSINDVYVFHATWADGSLKLYKDGSQIATGSTYTPPAMPSYVYVGSTSAAAEQGYETYLDAVTFERALSATEISNDYNNISEHLDGGDGYGQRLSPIPWAFFDQGDDITDNDFDTGASLYNHFFCGGIPGDIPAETNWHLEINDGGFDDQEAVFFGVQPFSYSNFTESGAQSLILGGEIVVADTSTPTPATEDADMIDFLEYNRSYYIWIRCIDAGSNLFLSFAYRPGGEGITTYYGTHTFDPDAVTYESFFLGPFVPGIKYIDGIVWGDSELYYGLGRTVAGAANVTTDFAVLFPSHLKIYFDNTMASASFVVTNKTGYVVTTSTSNFGHTPQITGEAQSLYPNNINMVLSAYGDSGKETTVTDTIGWKVYITPRWMVL